MRLSSSRLSFDLPVDTHDPNADSPAFPVSISGRAPDRRGAAATGPGRLQWRQRRRRTGGAARAGARDAGAAQTGNAGKEPGVPEGEAGRCDQGPHRRAESTQAAIGYDQIYYKLGRWQGDFARPTWAGDTTNQIDYLNRTVGKKFDDYCEDTGAGKRAQPFASIAQAQAARLDKPETFSCLNAPGADATAMKTVVVGWDGNLYLTDGHHSFSALREIFDGGPKLPVWVKVDANYSDMADAKAFWQRLVDERKAWLRDGDNQPITVDQLPKRLGLASAAEAGGMQEDRYRSLVYFTRDIAYANGGLPEFAEFLWGDWLRRQVAGQLPALSAYKMIPPAALASILAVSKLDKNLLPTDASDSYSAAVRDAAGKMAALADGDVVFQDRTAAQLGRIAWVQNAASGTPTKNARDALEDCRATISRPGLAAAQRRQALVRGQLPQLRQASGRHLLGLVRPAPVAALKGRCVRS